jgi:hypothetical protein
MPEYQAETYEYKTIQNDMWDLIALREYGDEHAMHTVQDANFDERFTDAFPGGTVLVIPQTVSIEKNLKSGHPVPPLAQLLPWR